MRLAPPEGSAPLAVVRAPVTERRRRWKTIGNGVSSRSVLAHATANLLANNIPAASGASKFGILGKLVQPPRLARGI